MRKLLYILPSLAAFLVISLVIYVAGSKAAVLTEASLSLSDPRVSQTSVTYTFDASTVTTSAIKCIDLIFTAAASGSTAPPTGIDASGAAFDATSDYVPTPASWSVAASAGRVSITFATGETPASATDRTVVLTGIDNGSTANTGYFVRFATYDNTDCASSGVDSITAGFIYTEGQSVSMTVDPSLSFSLAALAIGQSVNDEPVTVLTTTTTIPFGTVTTSANAVAAHTATVSTNAPNGYTLYVRYTGQLNNGTEDLDNHTGTNATPTTFSAAGTEAFGYTTEDFTLGTGTTDRFDSNLWAAFTTTNAEVAYSTGAVSNEATDVGYQVGINGATSAGTYTTTVIYTLTPIY